ncbi:MFS transporter [Aeromicrobium sp. Leaf350]|uniref:MFS transporter n=1 Tax=Aeromicrobium sp. Leaf350 TaxID=2876565 RepID=UPI001E34A115|nr:MFS transporter [Aeromicrobium sp. Leaf350]
MVTSSPRWTYPALLGLLMVSLGISAAPSPLYGIYAEEWGFAPITTTVVFAAYAIAALVSVLVSGSISDRYGRRPILLVAAAGLVVGLVLFMVAGSVPVLIAARVLHGLSVGAIVVVATAALLDLRPDEGASTGRRTGIAFNLGIFIAILGTAADAQYGPAPLVVPYAVLAALAAAGFVAVLLMRETHTVDRAVALNIARPRVPAEISGDFTFAALGVMASWSVLGVFLSLFPTIATVAVGTDNLVFGGLVVGGSALAAAASQQVASGWDARTAAVIGDVGTAVSLGACVLTVHIGNGWLLAAASVVLGFFFGLAFGSSLRHLGQVVPPSHRGEVMSAFYLLAYGAMAVPTIIAGAAATRWGVDAVFAPFMACVAAACLAAGALGARVRGVQPDA